MPAKPERLTHPAPQSAPTIRFDLVELETFLAVVELASFSQAALKLSISQPSVTGRIQRLESTLKTRLLVRTTRHVAPTPAGERLRDKAQEALKDLRSLLQEFQVTAEEERMRVVVGATPMIAAGMLPPIIRGFCSRYIDVQLQLRDLQYEDVVSRIASGDVDLAVVAFDNDFGAFEFEPLTHEDMLLVVPSSHPLAQADHITLDQLADAPLMFLERYASLQATLAQAYASRGLTLRATQQAANLSTLLGMVDAGNGVTFLPRSMAQLHAVGTRSTVRVSDVALTRSFGILRARGKERSPAAERFCDYLRDALARPPAVDQAL